MADMTTGVDGKVLRGALNLAAGCCGRVANNATMLSHLSYLPAGNRSKPSPKQLVFEMEKMIEDLDPVQEALEKCFREIDPTRTPKKEVEGKSKAA